MTSKIIGEIVDHFCTCGYILPSAGYQEPEVHGPHCAYVALMNHLAELEIDAQSVNDWVKKIQEIN